MGGIARHQLRENIPRDHRPRLLEVDKTLSNLKVSDPDHWRGESHWKILHIERNELIADRGEIICALFGSLVLFDKINILFHKPFRTVCFSIEYQKGHFYPISEVHL